MYSNNRVKEQLKVKSIIIDGKEFNILDYSSLKDLVDIEFEGKDLSKIEVEDFEDIPDRLYNKTPVPCTLEEALEDTESFDTIFDWVDYVQDNNEDATIAYIDNQWSWDRNHFEDSYEGYFNSEEDFAEEYLDEIGWDIDFSSYFDYSKYGEKIWNDYDLDSYTPEALEDYREELGLPPLDDNEDPKSRKELEMAYGFIGDYTEEGEELNMELGDSEELERAQEEYDRFVEDHSLEIYLADLDDSAEIAETYINESYGGMDYFVREEDKDMRDYVDIESFTRDLFYDYTFVDGYVFNNY